MTRRRLVEKLVGYAAWFSEGGHTKKHGIRNFRVLTVTRSPERALNLGNAAVASSLLSGGLDRFWFSAETAWGAGGPLSILDAV